MNNLTMRARGFILLEALVALSILIIFISYFWKTQLFQVSLYHSLRAEYAEKRLSRDLYFLIKIGDFGAINPYGYDPYEIIFRNDITYEIILDNVNVSPSFPSVFYED